MLILMHLLNLEEMLNLKGQFRQSSRMQMEYVLLKQCPMLDITCRHLGVKYSLGPQGEAFVERV